MLFEINDRGYVISGVKRGSLGELL